MQNFREISNKQTQTETKNDNFVDCKDKEIQTEHSEFFTKYYNYENKSIQTDNTDILTLSSTDTHSSDTLSTDTGSSDTLSTDTDSSDTLSSDDDNLDYAVAISETKTRFNISKTSKTLPITDERWELIDPHPDIHALFVEFDEKYFYKKLQAVEIMWNPHMFETAGICWPGGNTGRCQIELSEPLLKLRPRKDLVETLLHEMIHAYLLITNNNQDNANHGPLFISHMERINKESGSNITVEHSFIEEIARYLPHWWKCDGPCKNLPPDYGIQKRAVNVAPGPNDNGWALHKAICGGTFVKVLERVNCNEIVPNRKSVSHTCIATLEDRETQTDFGEKKFPIREGEVPKRKFDSDCTCQSFHIEISVKVQKHG